MLKSEALRYRRHIQTAVQGLPVESAIEVKTLYPTWEELVKLGQVESDEAGYKFIYGNDLYVCVNANPTFQADWVPGNGTEALYTRIDESHAGTEEDPIPYEGNMVLEKGKYYSQDGVVYLCVRDTTNPVYHALKDLLGLYLILA